MLVAAALAYGAIAGVLFRFFTHSDELRRTWNQIVARLMEIPLFADQPGTVLRAQAGVVRENLRLLRLVAAPVAVMSILSVAIYPVFERRFAIDARRSNVLTLQEGQGLPPGVVAETPPVHVLRTREVSWRVRVPNEREARWFGRHWLIWFGAISSAAAVVTGLLKR